MTHIGIVDQPDWLAGRLYVENLIRNLSRLPESARPSVTWFGSSRPEHDELSGFTCIDTGSEGDTSFTKRFAATARLAKREPIDFLYPFPYRIVGGPATGHWIPDVQHFKLPEMFSRTHRLRRDILFRGAIMASKTIVVSSTDTLNDVAEMTRLLRSKEVNVLHFCTPLHTDDVASQPELDEVLPNLPPEYLYLPNQMWRHKDHPTALRALAVLKERGKTVSLVLSGDRMDRRNPRWSQHVGCLARELKIEDQLRFAGRLDRRIQLRLLLGSRAVVQPSLFEGWSTVLEDCRSLAVPIMASDLAVHREQDLANARYFAPRDGEGLANCIEQELRTSRVRPTLDALISNADARSVSVATQLVDIATVGAEN